MQVGEGLLVMAVMHVILQWLDVLQRYWCRCRRGDDEYLSLLIVTAAFRRTPCRRGLHRFQVLHGGGDERVGVNGDRGEGRCHTRGRRQVAFDVS
jgi:hypothetical protein